MTKEGRAFARRRSCLPLRNVSSKHTRTCSKVGFEKSKSSYDRIVSLSSQPTKPITIMWQMIGPAAMAGLDQLPK